MSMKMITTIGFVTHVLVGSFCFMPMALAMSVPHAAPDQEIMVMTPVEPMSPAHCRECLHMQQAQSQPTSMQGNCNGQCLSSHIPDASTSSIFSSSLQLPDVSLVAAVVTPVSSQTIGLPLNTAPPDNLPMLASLGTVVLRQ
jgi:hypothetical protein